MIYILLIALLTCIIYRVITKRDKKKEQIEFDAFVVESAVRIVKDIRELKNPYAQSLEKDKEFNLVFEKGFVYYEIAEKHRECVVTPIQELNDKENKNFAELVYNSLLKENKFSVSIMGGEITVSKA